MKRSFLVQWLVLGLIVGLGGSGCKHPQKGLTPIPNRPVTINNPPPSGPTSIPSLSGGGTPTDAGARGTSEPIGPNGTNPLAPMASFEGRDVDYKPFEADTVYFDFDRSSVKASERSKIEDVANQLKNAAPGMDLVVEGHCDERGTEEYNRALGERRALAIREYLVGLGIGAERIRTISYGEDKPADPGHDEAAWSKNRRGVFGMLLPKK